MSEAAATRLDSGLDALAATAWTLEPPQPSERKGLARDEAAFLLDGLLIRLARGRGALDVAIGEGLAAASAGDRLLRLGYSSLRDYARERLGIAASTAEKMTRLARELRDRPLLCEAVRRGEVSARKAEALLPVARGDAEVGWVARARVETVHSLQDAVKEARGDEPEPDEQWERLEAICAELQRLGLLPHGGSSRPPAHEPARRASIRTPPAPQPGTSTRSARRRWGGSPGAFHLLTDDVEALWKRALAAGANELQPLGERFGGERFGQLVDPFGHPLEPRTTGARGAARRGGSRRLGGIRRRSSRLAVRVGVTGQCMAAS